MQQVPVRVEVLAGLRHSQGKGRRRLGFPQQSRKSLSILMRH